MYLRYTYNTATAKQLLDDLKTIFTSTATVFLMAGIM